jgi:SOS response associated peptidase (SRAP)
MRRSRRVSATVLRASKVKTNMEAASEGTGVIRPETVRWGLIPHWAKDEKTAYKMINAWVETLTQQPAFRGLLSHNRCLVPASGFSDYIDEGVAEFYGGMSCGKMRLSLAKRRASWLLLTPPARFPPHGSARPVTIFSSFSKRPIFPLWSDTGSAERGSSIPND